MATALAARVEYRVPFDILEAESELVAGFRVEYSGMKYGMFMTGEYAELLTSSALLTTTMGGMADVVAAVRGAGSAVPIATNANAYRRDYLLRSDNDTARDAR